MATLDNIQIPPKQWVDLYALSGVQVGTRIKVQNLSSSSVYLNSNETQPSDISAYNKLGRSKIMINDSGDAGAWAYSRNGATVNVGVA